MNHKAGFGSSLECACERASRSEKQRALISSIWNVECIRGGEKVWEEQVENLCTDQGLNKLLDVMFHATTQITTWYIALFNSDTTVLSTHTYAVPGYTESSQYSESTRPEFVEAAASGKSTSNTASKATFTINTTTTIYGAALVGGGSAATTKGDTAGGGTLYCAAKFTTPRSCENLDVLKVTVTLTASDV